MTFYLSNHAEHPSFSKPLVVTIYLAFTIQKPPSQLFNQPIEKIMKNLFFYLRSHFYVSKLLFVCHKTLGIKRFAQGPVALSSKLFSKDLYLHLLSRSYSPTQQQLFPGFYMDFYEKCSDSISISSGHSSLKTLIYILVIYILSATIFVSNTRIILSLQDQ